MQRNAYGLGAPLRTLMERQIVGSVRPSLPSPPALPLSKRLTLIHLCDGCAGLCASPILERAGPPRRPQRDRRAARRPPLLRPSVPLPPPLLWWRAETLTVWSAQAGRWATPSTTRSGPRWRGSTGSTRLPRRRRCTIEEGFSDCLVRARSASRPRRAARSSTHRRLHGVLTGASALEN